ncbi:uncharacterized protein LOC125649111 isoform X2 [Ostrea edulis]|uniref:uncharacterized protein LOC125649111 isoform X2 n=1 Tax=Ostrea edulis TaxID=37623 RepID=UPI0020947445|nr:uncharacterized protein LOC125649111 isoform X2 [Ostrea edulis]
MIHRKCRRNLCVRDLAVDVSHVVWIDTNDVNIDFIQYVGVETTDRYREGRPYKMFLYPGGSTAILSINMPNIKLAREVKVTLNHCKTNCNGVIDVLVNDSELVRGYTGTRWDNFGEQTFNIPLDMLTPGTNMVTIRLNEESRGVYWLSDLKIETVMK